jgi:acetyl esterase/lipase
LELSPQQGLYYNAHVAAILEDFKPPDYRAVLHEIETRVREWETQQTSEQAEWVKQQRMRGYRSTLAAADATAFIDMGLPGMSVDERRSPEISPLLNDLTGLPPALFTVGDLDPLRDDTILMAQRWQLAGSDAELDVWPEGAHAFANMATPLGDLALDRTTAWISSVLDVRESQ